MKKILLTSCCALAFLSGTALAGNDKIANSLVWMKDGQYETGSEMESTYIGSNSSADVKVYYQGTANLTENAGSGWNINFWNDEKQNFSKYCGYLNITYSGGKYYQGTYKGFSDGDTYCYLKNIKVDNWNGGFTVSAGSIDTSYNDS